MTRGPLRENECMNASIKSVLLVRKYSVALLYESVLKTFGNEKDAISGEMPAIHAQNSAAGAQSERRRRLTRNVNLKKLDWKFFSRNMRSIRRK